MTRASRRYVCRVAKRQMSRSECASWNPSVSIGATASDVEIMGAVTLAVASLLLLWAGGRHLARADSFRAVLDAHGLLPPLVRGIVVRVLPLGEVFLGVSGMTMVVLGAQPVPAARPLVLGQALLYAAFCAYSAMLPSGQTAGGCGCLRADGPASRAATAARAGLLSAGLVLTWLSNVPQVGLAMRFEAPEIGLFALIVVATVSALGSWPEYMYRPLGGAP